MITPEKYTNPDSLPKSIVLTFLIWQTLKNSTTKKLQGSSTARTACIPLSMIISVYGTVMAYRYHCFLPKPMAENTSWIASRQTAVSVRSNSSVSKKVSTRVRNANPTTAVITRVFIAVVPFQVKNLSGSRQKIRLP